MAARKLLALILLLVILSGCANSDGASSDPVHQDPEEMTEDPAECAAMAWDALFTYPAHEAPIRVLALLDTPGSPGDVIFQEMVQAGKLQPKGVYYANLPPATPAPSESPSSSKRACRRGGGI